MPRQELQDLVDRYLAASNARDLDAVFELMHRRVAYYDALRLTRPIASPDWP